MIITGGKLKGKRIKTPKGELTRPSSAIIKESLFNILHSNIVDSIFIDLFAGSGSVGLEAISHGAKRVIFVENNQQNIKIIKENIKILNVESNCRIIHSDVTKSINLVAEEKPNIIFLDPPYDFVEVDYISEIFLKIQECKIPTIPGYLVLQSPANKNLETIEVDRLKLIKKKKYGKSHLSFWLPEPLLL